MEWKPWINIGTGKCLSSQLSNMWWGVRVKKGKGEGTVDPGMGQKVVMPSVGGQYQKEPSSGQISSI